jgi:hypothetical protein
VTVRKLFREGVATFLLAAADELLLQNHYEKKGEGLRHALSRLFGSWNSVAGCSFSSVIAERFGCIACYKNV